MGGKAKGGNNAMMMYEMQQANDARMRDYARTARLNQGAARINELFEGRPIYEGGGYGYENLPPGAYISADQQRVIGADGRDIGAFSPTGGGGKEIGREGGIGEDFYNRFKQGAIDFYKPEIERQFGKAKDQLTYSAANAGTLRSSETGNQLADLVAQNDVNTAVMHSKVNDQVGQLKNQVAANKAALINQLYATEDPDATANQAVNAVQNVQLTTPSLDPIGELFKPAAMGLTGAMAGFQASPFAGVKYPGASGGSAQSGKSPFGKTY